MNEENNVEFAEFETAFNDADDYQIASEEDTAAEETVEETETGDEGTEEAPEEETDGNENPGAGEEAEDQENKENPADQKFTIKVNKQSREVGLAEMTELAQKGADYDRVKDLLAESRQNIETMQGQMAQYQTAYQIVEDISKQAGMTMEQTIRQIQMNFKMQGGKTEAEAAAELRAEAAERELNAVRAKQTQQQTADHDAKDRANREVAEFHKRFPGVELTRELAGELMADVKNGIPLAEAYQRRENAKQAEKIAELERQLAAEKQNKKNRSNSPGSQKDSGGRRAKTDYDDFMAAFE